MVSSARSPHEYPLLAETAVNTPTAASSSASLFMPQQTMVVSARRPHEYPVLAETAVNTPAGASA